jgi:two-component system aerobic respiration control protein ArcA
LKQNERDRLTKRILVVEEDVMVRNALVRILAEETYEVLEAASVAEALRVSGQFNGIISLLISDQSLKTITGLELAEQILRSRSGLLAFQFCAAWREDLALQARLMFEAGILQTPFLSRDLADEVRRILEPLKTEK